MWGASPAVYLGFASRQAGRSATTKGVQIPAPQQPIAVIGAGDVVRTRYLAGLATQRRLRLAHVLSLEETCAIDVDYTRLPDDVPTAARVIADRVPADWPIVIATPTPTHVPYGIALAQTHRRLVIEKPLTTSSTTRARFEATVGPPGSRWFPLAYYLLEKGLPLLPLLQPELRVAAVLDLLSPGASPDELQELRRALGDLRRITGCIFEGRGGASSLLARPWVLRPGGGGNTFDTFFHLACVLASAAGGPVTDLVVRPALADGYPAGSAETATLVTGCLGGVGLALGAAKHVSAGAHERWIQLEFDGGQLRMDFETCALQGQVRGHRDVALRLADPTPYAAQFALVGAWLDDPALPLPRDVLRRALTFCERVARASEAGVQTRYERGARASDIWSDWPPVC